MAPAQDADDKMAKIAVDADGVLADFDEGFIEIVNKMFPGRIPANYVHHDWDYSEVLAKDEVGKVFSRIRHHNNWWLGLSPLGSSVTDLASWLISNSGHDVYVCTARFPTVGMTVAKQTEWWLKSCGLTPVNNFLGIIVVADSTLKIDVYRATGIEYSIDDKAETVEACDALPGHKAYLLDQPWNRTAKVKRRVKAVAEFLREVR
jgi:5'(3')-deoxyribonucleotidase